MKSLQDLSGRSDLEASGWVPRVENAGPGQVRSRPDRPSSYRSARIRTQILEVRAINGLQGLQLVILSLRIAFLRLSPAASRGSAAPSHGGRGRRSGLGEVAALWRAMEGYGSKPAWRPRWGRGPAPGRRSEGRTSSEGSGWGRSLEQKTGPGAWLCAGWYGRLGRSLEQEAGLGARDLPTDPFGPLGRRPMGGASPQVRKVRRLL
ncbi:hypothetical protein NN561_009508 [Cricetulus griseus]